MTPSKHSPNSELRVLSLPATLLAIVVLLASGMPSVSAEDAGEHALRVTPFTQGPLKIGAFNGGFHPDLAARYEAWLGRPSDFNVTFLTDTAFTPYTKADGTKVTDAMAGSGWLLDAWSKANRPERNMLFSIPLATKQDPSLANVAAGNYDAVYQAVARMIAHRYPNAVIRIGWEFNGDWYAWQAKGRAQDYIDAFRHVSKIFKDAAATFTIDWCPAQGFSGKMQSDTAYPGDDVVDVIGMDIYNDYKWGDYKDDPKKRWEWNLNYPFGLAWQARFAHEHRKPMSLPEWGVNRDDPYFIERMHDWITTHDYAYVAYWDSNSAFMGMLSREQYPQASSTYRQLFGQAH